MEKNATLYAVKSKKNGKTYTNFYVSVELDNGATKVIPVKVLFAKPKFISLLVHNLLVVEGN